MRGRSCELTRIGGQLGLECGPFKLLLPLRFRRLGAGAAVPVRDRGLGCGRDRRRTGGIALLGTGYAAAGGTYLLGRAFGATVS